MHKRPISAIILGLLFIVAILQNIYQLKSYFQLFHYIVYEKAGIAWIFFAVVGIGILLDICVLWFIWKPKIAGFWIGLSSVVFSLMNRATIFFIAFPDIPGLKEFFLSTRKAYGLTQNPTIDQIFSEKTVIWTLIWGIFFTIVFGFFLIKNKKYFRHGLDPNQ